MKDENQIGEPVDDNLLEILNIPNAADERARVDLASAITRKIWRRGLTQAQAAQLLGISKAEVAAIRNARIDGFSRERLDEMLKAL
jgi:predicted XRE-type DNA-binding protein